jgi:hypothetical protein
MDDEKTLRVAFPIGETGDTLTLKQPSPAQLLTLTMLKVPEGAETGAMFKMVQRLFRIVENLAGSEEWDRLQDGMADESYAIEDVLQVVQDLVGFNWSEADPGPVEPETPTAVAEAYIEERAKRPAPRVVGRA